MPIVEFALADGHRLLVNARPQTTTVMVDEALTLNLDREGRLTSAWLGGRNYRRGLDNRIIEKQGGPQPGLSYRVRRELDANEGREFLARAYARLAEYNAALREPATRVLGAASADEVAVARAALDEAARCDLARLDRDRETFQRIYKPISILPPDQYLALVLQATEGCSYNACAFCGFYRDRSFRIKTPMEFERHIAAVRAFLGKALGSRKTIFLADANALVIPQEQLIPIFDAIGAEFALLPRGLGGDARAAWQAEHPVHFEGIYSFVDAFTTRRKTAREFASLAERGLRRVYIGLESGDAELLHFLGKPNSPDDVAQLVERVKAGGVAVGIIILAGAGGARYAEQHVRQTTALVNALPLDEGDLIYFSELVDYPGSNYAALTRAAGIRPLTIDEIARQVAEMRARFEFEPPAPKVSYYDIREFIY